MHRGNLLIESKLLLIERVKFSLLLFLSAALLFQGCAVGQSPVKKIQSELQGEKEYAIILNDMREKGNFFPSYYHQYRVDVGEQKTVRPFVEVDKSYYKKNQPYLGMVLTAKTSRWRRLHHTLSKRLPIRWQFPVWPMAGQQQRRQYVGVLRKIHVDVADDELGRIWAQSEPL